MTDVLNREHTGVAIALTVRLQLVSANSGRPLHGGTIRLWPCDHGTGHRGPRTVEVRISDECGWTEFDVLLPVAGPGHWPHLHFEIPGRQLADDQIADHQIADREIPDREIADHQIPGRRIPDADTAAGEIGGRRGRLVLPADAYAAGALRRPDLATAFGPGETLLMASVTGDAHRGLVATRTLTLR